MNQNPIILGIETSCDETAAAIVQDHYVIAEKTTVQILHEKYGGVVPELASRAHEQLLMSVVQSSLLDSKLMLSDIDGIAVTHGPGLAGALLVGVSLAKGLSISTAKPLIGVNHIEGHLWSCELGGEQVPEPFLALIISGGHTMLVKVDGFSKYQLLGSTRDDAAGELLDKTGRMMGFGFPAGADIDSAALSNSDLPIKFPRSKLVDDPFGFSFSGLKTSVLYYLRERYPEVIQLRKGFTSKGFEMPAIERQAICAGLMGAVSDMLISGISKAMSKYSLKALVICGGVSASRYLRDKFSEFAEANSVNLYVPPLKYSTDNGAMIANAGIHHYHRGEFSKLDLTVNPALQLIETNGSKIPSKV